MKNPLNRRLTRELKGELGKYLVILILLIASNIESLLSENNAL